ncbi:hypothetical protein [Aquamicrobium terrae]|uniref:XRE family transcriptional regulator n=1 Tax=Aquamicrobium terrae TaxID=1324945 RepID=A0ABV2MSQ9_9HYPH
MTDEKLPVRVSEWEVQADRLVEKQAAAHQVAGEVAVDGRAYAVDAPNGEPVFRSGTVADVRQYERAVHDLTMLGADASPEERKALAAKVQRKRNKLVFAKKKQRPGKFAYPERHSKINVPDRLKPDYRTFEAWLIESLESVLSKNAMNFCFWCTAEVDAGRIDLDRLGFSKDMIAKVKSGGAFGPEEFLSVVTGIHLDRVRKGFEILHMGHAPAELERLQGAGQYLSNDELDLCLTACREWCGYDEGPGVDQASAVVRELFEEMKRRRIDKHELSARAHVAVTTLDSWNNSDAAKRKPPSLPKIAACLEAMGLRLLVVPEAEVPMINRLRRELAEQEKATYDRDWGKKV